MRHWELVDHDTVPDHDGTVYLMERGGQYAIHVDGRELMATGPHGSEDALAHLACDCLADLQSARVLVGGLGLGYTLAAVLERIGRPHGRVVVAELIPAVVRWNREIGKLARAAGRPLTDPRARVYLGDVADLIERPEAPFSAILLDVDNGPRSLTRPTNGWLYSAAGAAAAAAALIPGGVLAVWSAHHDDSLTATLMNAGLAVEVVAHVEPDRPTLDREGTHVVWLARRPTEPSSGDPHTVT